MSMIVAFFTLWLAPTVKQGLYWRSSMLPSFGPIIGVLFLAAFILLMRPVRWYSYVIIFLFSIFNAGLSENGAAYQLVMTGIIFIISFWEIGKQSPGDNRLLKLSILAAVGTVCGTIIMWLSPGIAVHLEKASTSIWNTTILSILHAYNHYKEMVLSRFPHFLILSLLGFIFFFIIISENKHFDQIKDRKFIFWLLPILIIQIITFVFIISLTFPSAFTRNAYPDPRHFMGSTLIIVITFLSSGFVLGGLVVSLINKIDLKLLKQLSKIGLVILILISLTYPVWAIPQITSEEMKFKYWAMQWDRRHKKILEAKEQGFDEIHVMRMDHIIEGVGELGSKSSDPYYNLPASQYYGIEIVADEPGWDEGYQKFIHNN